MEIFLTTLVLGCVWMAFRQRKPTRLGLREPAMSGYLPPDSEYRPDYGEREYESELTPHAKMYRHEWEEEQRALKTINGLLDSLTPADAEADLFTAWERGYFGLQAHKKRPVE